MKRLVTPLLLVLVLLSCQQSQQDQQDTETQTSAETRTYDEVYLDPSEDIDTRVWDLVSKLTVDEKIAQLNYDAPAIERLNIPAYNWWNECLHGVARAGRATVFPQAIGMGATFDEDLIFRVSSAISDEARAKYNAAVKKGVRQIYSGLTFWSPNVNIFRDPRWGRGQETYGEDPYLMGKLGSAFVRGLQGDHPKYMKAAACAKHYVVHSGPEGLRHEFNAVSSKKDMYETYLPAFESLVDTGVEAVMCAYNRTNGEPCCGSKTLLQDVLRGELGFDGHIVSDCWALVDFHSGHNVTKNSTESAALALKSGVNVNCGDTYPYLKDALEQGLIEEADIDTALHTLMKTRFKLGMFDPEDMVPFNDIGTEVINSEEHQQLALETARKSIVMLKNEDNVLPLSKDIKSLFVTGPNAASTKVLLGNYYGVSSNLVTILEGIVGTVTDGSIVQHKQGFLLDRENINPIDWTTEDAQASDAMVVAMGISVLLEGEEGAAIASPTKGDRFKMDIPQNQIDFLEKLRRGNDKPIIAVVTGGSPLDMQRVHELADAVLFAWYPGEQGGNAVADIIFGDVSPSGRLPITFPRSVDQLPPYEDYNMEGRTYRYMTKEPMYPFGYGLSFTNFSYSGMQLSKSEIAKDESLEATFTVTNNGDVKGEEVVQLYIADKEASFRVPLQSLRGIKRVALEPGASETITMEITPEMIEQINMEGKPVIEPGEFEITVGGSSPGKRSAELGVAEPLTASFNVQ